MHHPDASAGDATDPPPAAATPRRADPYAAWRIRQYQLYAAGWFLLTFAKQIQTIAVLIYIHRQNRDPMDLGLVGFVQALPVMLLAIPAGQMADRVDRRRVMLCTISLSTTVALGLAALSHLALPVFWMYCLVCVGAVGMALGGPSRAALLPQVVPAETFSNAITWNSSIFQMASMVGPAIGGVIVATAVGATGAFLIVAGCLFLSLMTMFFLRCRPAERSNESLSLQSLAAGVRFVFRNKLILAPITLDLFAVLLGGAVYLLPIFAEDILGVGPRGVGFLRSAEAVGSVAMAMVIAHRPPMQRAGRTMLWAVAGFGAATVVFGLSRNFWLSLAMMFLIGAFDNISVVVRHTLVQMLTPEPMRGRVSAVNNVFIVASNDLGGMESGVAAKLFGPVLAVVGGGIGTILVVVAAARRWPQILAIGSLTDLKPIRTEVVERADEELAARGP